MIPRQVLSWFHSVLHLGTAHTVNIEWWTSNMGSMANIRQATPWVSRNYCTRWGPRKWHRKGGIKTVHNSGTIAGCKMVPNVRCKMGAYNMFTRKFKVILNEPNRSRFVFFLCENDKLQSVRHFDSFLWSYGPIYQTYDITSWPPNGWNNFC